MGLKKAVHFLKASEYFSEGVYWAELCSAASHLPRPATDTLNELILGLALQTAFLCISGAASLGTSSSVAVTNYTLLSHSSASCPETYP